MPINIVDPYGVISFVDAPFTKCGNRGPIDNGHNVTKAFAHPRWIYCVTDALRDPNEFMTGSTFTDLFFLDEVTALAAGHRPCHQCNRARAVQFDAAWNEVKGSVSAKVDEIDRILNEERMTKMKEKVTFQAKGDELPPGTFMLFHNAPFLLTETLAYPWSSLGYGVPKERPSGMVDVLTPRSIVEVLQTGTFEVLVESLTMRWANAH